MFLKTCECTHDLINTNHTISLCPQNSAPAITPGQKWWQTVLEIEISYVANGKAQHALMKGVVFSCWGWGGRDFFCFSPCSQCVSNMFSSCSPRSRVVPQDVPNSTSILSHIVCPKFNSHVYELKSYVVGEYICFYFTNVGPKRCVHWGVHTIPRKLLMGQWMWLFQRKIKCHERTHELIDMNHTILDYPFPKALNNIMFAMFWIKQQLAICQKNQHSLWTYKWDNA